MTIDRTHTHTRTNRHTHWQQHITAWQQSNLSQAAFCKAHQLSYHQFIYWRQKLLSQSSDAPATPSKQLVPVHCVPTEPATSDLSLTLPNGVCIHGIGSQLS
ncbi:MAG: hypothetical protein P8X89_02545 [Reinekea sp.]